MTTPPMSPVPDFATTPVPRKRVLWKWSLALTAVVLTYFMWQCGLALMQGHAQADVAVEHFHQELNQEQFEQIYQDADEGFASSGKSEELVKFLEAVHRKLGDANTATFRNINVNATTNGTFITTNYETSFARGSATETFTWVKQNGGLKLYGYHIQSRELVLN